MSGHWNGCPACEGCPDRTPYTKCSATCLAHREWQIKHDAVKKIMEDGNRVYAAISDHRTDMVVKARKKRRDKMK